MQTLTGNMAHQQAVRYTASLWQTRAFAGKGDPAEVSSSVLIGWLEHLENGSPVYVMSVQGTAQDCFGENYSIDQTVTVRLSEQGEPIGRSAVDQEYWQALQHSHGEMCVEYGC